MVNRSVIIVRAKEPFLNWIQSLPDQIEPDLTLESLNSDPNAYLVYEILDEESKMEILEMFYKKIFNSELESWWTDSEDWPYVDNLDEFHKWFDVSFCSFVDDLVEEEEPEEEDERDQEKG